VVLGPVGRKAVQSRSTKVSAGRKAVLSVSAEDKKAICVLTGTAGVSGRGLAPLPISVLFNFKSTIMRPLLFVTRKQRETCEQITNQRTDSLESWFKNPSPLSPPAPSPAHRP